MRQTRSNIAPALDAFVGRQTELDWLRDVAPTARLVTLVGPAGAGKTRLSREFAAQDATRAVFEDIWFCDLCNARGAEDVIDALAQVWSVQVRGGTLGERAESLAALAAAQPRALLILDNFETVLDDAALIVLAWSKQLTHTFLITSTTGLDVRGERELSIGPLSPDAAADLFIERAFGETRREHTGDDVQTAGRIADRLDRLPLAVELAARQAEILSPAEIEAHLDSAFELLSTAPRDAPVRHSSLGAMVAWGWARLQDSERALMEAASLFEGGFTIAALATVAGLDEAPVRRELLALRRKSMVAVSDGATRLSLLNTLSTFARARLAEQPERMRELQLRHLRTYAQLSQKWVASLNRTDGANSRAALEHERANVVAALRCAVEVELEARDYEAALHVGLALRALHDRRGVVQETPSLLAELLAIGAYRIDIDLGLHARLRAGCGELRRRAGDPEGAKEVSRAVEQARTAEDAGALAVALMAFGEVLFVGGERDEALAAYAEAVAAAERAKDDQLELEARQSFVVAKAFLGRSNIEDEEAVYRLAVKLGDAWIEATCLTNMGIRYRAEGRLELAIPSFETAIERFTELGDVATAGHVMLFLGIAYLHVDAFDEAEAVLMRARAPLRQRGPEVRHMADLAIARVKVARGERIIAEQLLDDVLRKTVSEGAVETETLARTERIYLACAARDEERLRVEVAALPDLNAVRSFDAREEARMLIAMASDLDEEGTPNLDAIRAELPTDDLNLRAFALIQQAMVIAVRGWRPGADHAADAGRMRDRLGELARFRGFDPHAVFSLRRWLVLLEPVSANQLHVARDYSRIRTADGTSVDLRKKGRTRAVLRALIEARVASCGEPITADEVFAFAWPKTSIRQESAMARVYTAMSEIRKMGFDSVLERTDVGYRIRADVEVVFCDPDEAKLGAD